MRFDRYILRETSYEVTPRKLAAAKRAIEKDRERCGLFPEMMEFHRVEDRIDAIANGRRQWVDEMRKNQVDSWRRARRLLRDLPATTQAGVRRYWAQSNMPGHPVYLLGLIHDAKAKGTCFWRRLANLHRLKLMGAGRQRFSIPLEMNTPTFRGP